MTETPQELIARLMQHVEDTMVEASVDYPAGHEAGASISYDSDFLQKCFETELAASLARKAVLRDALVVIAQAKSSTSPAMNIQTIWNVTERAIRALIPATPPAKGE
jgi:hypothetical protein